MGSEMCIRDRASPDQRARRYHQLHFLRPRPAAPCLRRRHCLLYTSDAADDMQCVDLGGRRGHAGLLAADHPAKPEHGTIVGDDAHVVVDLIGLAVEAKEFLALAAQPRADRTVELVGVIDMERTAAVVGNVVGDIDERVDRAKPCLLYTSPSPRDS